MAVTLMANLTCPQCAFTQPSEMATDACQFFRECIGCQAVLRPNPGDCCVFCSYADVQCPSKQG